MRGRSRLFCGARVVGWAGRGGGGRWVFGWVCSGIWPRLGGSGSVCVCRSRVEVDVEVEVEVDVSLEVQKQQPKGSLPKDPKTR